MSPDQVVEIADRDTTIAKLAEALSALRTGRNGDETMGLPAPMRRAAAEGLANLGFRYIDALATARVVMPKTPMGAHAIPTLEKIDRGTIEAALDAFNPALAAQYRAATTDEARRALLAELEPEVQATLAKSMDMDQVASAIRAQGKNEAAAAREAADRKQREG